MQHESWSSRDFRIKRMPDASEDRKRTIGQRFKLSSIKLAHLAGVDTFQE
jgi:hypothetical protein